MAPSRAAARPRGGQLPWAVCGVLLARAAAGSPASRGSIVVPLRRVRPASPLSPPAAAAAVVVVDGAGAAAAMPAQVAVAAEAINSFRGEHVEALRNVGDVQYIGTVLIGSPGQEVEVLFDTGSSDLWLFSGVLDPAASRTARNTSGDISITYGQGSVRGGVTLDDVAIKGMAAVTGQPVITLQDSKGMSTVASGGVFGLALPALCHTGETFLQRLQEQQNISKFTFLLTDDEDGSQLVFGEPNPEWYGGPDRLVWVPALGDRWWALWAEMHVDPARAGGRPLELRGPVVMDSGTSYLAASEDNLEDIMSHLMPDPQQRARCQKKKSGSIDSTFCPCDVEHYMNDFLVEISDGSRHLTVTLGPDQLLLAVDQSLQTCVLQLISLPPGFPFILGDTFLRQVAVVFDTAGHRMGIGPRGSQLGNVTAQAAGHRIRSFGASQGGGTNKWLYVLWGCLVCVFCWCLWRECKDWKLGPAGSWAPSAAAARAAGADGLQQGLLAA